MIRVFCLLVLLCAQAHGTSTERCRRGFHDLGRDVDPQAAITAAQKADGNDHAVTTDRSNLLHQVTGDLPWDAANRVVDVIYAGAGVHATAHFDALIAEHPDLVGVALDEASKLTARVYGAQTPGAAQVNMTASADTVSRNPEYKLFTHGPDQFQLIGLPYGSLLPSTGIAYATRHTATRTGLNTMYTVKPKFLHYEMAREMVRKGELPPEYLAAWPKHRDGTPVAWRAQVGELKDGKPNFLYTDNLQISNGLGDARIIGSTAAEKAIVQKHYDARLKDPNHVGSVLDGMYTLKDTDPFLEGLVQSQGYAVHIGGGYTSLVNVQNLARAKARLRAAGKLTGPDKPDVIVLRGDAADVDIMRLLGFVKKSNTKPGKVSLADYDRLPDAELTPDMIAFRKTVRVVRDAKYGFHEVTEHGEELAVTQVEGFDLITGERVNTTEKSKLLSSAGAENRGLLPGGFFGDREPIFENVYGQVANDYGPFAAQGRRSVVGRRIVGFRAKGKEDFWFSGDSGALAIGPSSHTTARGRDGELLGPMATDVEQVGVSRADLPEIFVRQIRKAAPAVNDADILRHLPVGLLDKYLFPEADSAAANRYGAMNEETLGNILAREAPADFVALLDKHGLRPQMVRLFTEAVAASRGPSNTSRDSLKSTMPRTKAAVAAQFVPRVEALKAHGEPPKLPLARSSQPALKPGNFDQPANGHMPAYPTAQLPVHLVAAEKLDRAAVQNQLLNAFIGALEGKVRIESPGRPGAGVIIFVQKPGSTEIEVKSIGIDGESTTKITQLLGSNEYFRQMLDVALRREGGSVSMQYGFRPDGSFNPIRTRLRPNVITLGRQLADGLEKVRGQTGVSETMPGSLPDDLAHQLTQGLPTRPFPAPTYRAGGEIDDAATVKAREDYISDWSRASARIPWAHGVHTKFIGKKEGSDALLYLVSVSIHGQPGQSAQYVVAMHPNGRFAEGGSLYQHDRGLSQALATSYPGIRGFFPDVLDVGLVQGRNIGHYSLNEYVMVVQSATSGKPLYQSANRDKFAADVGKRIAELHGTSIPIPKSRRFSEFVEAQVNAAAPGDKEKVRAFLDGARWRNATAHGALSADNVHLNDTSNDGGVLFTGGFHLTEGRHPIEDLQTLFADLYRRLPTEAMKLEPKIRDAYLKASGLENDPLARQLLESPQWRAAHRR